MSRLTMALAISPLTCATALRTPLPPYRSLSPSRSSSASRSPVDAPDGTAARPNAPLSSVMSTSTVGLPRESRISRACTLVIFTTMSLDGWRSLVAAPVGVRFEAQGFFAERADERLVIGRDDDDAGVRHGVAAAIFREVVSDERAARNQHVAIDDRA